MKAKPNQLKAQWSESHKDIVFAWGDGADKSDAHLLYAALNLKMKDGGTSLQEELFARGYDLTTLRFSIQKKRPTQRAADVCLCSAYKEHNFKFYTMAHVELCEYCGTRR